MKVLLVLPGTFGSAFKSNHSNRTIFPGTIYDYIKGRLQRRRYSSSTYTGGFSLVDDPILEEPDSIEDSENEHEIYDSDDSAAASSDSTTNNKNITHTYSNQRTVMNDRDFDLICEKNLRPTKIISSICGLSVYSSFLRHMKKFTSFTLINDITQKAIKDCQNVMYIIPWNWINGRGDAIKRIIQVMHEFQRLFNAMQQSKKVYFDGFLLLGHSEGGCAAVLATERWNKTYGSDGKYAKILRVMCVASPLNGSEKAINVLEGNSKGVHWFSNSQLLHLNSLPHCKMLYELLPYEYLITHQQDPKMSKKKIQDALQYYADLKPGGTIPYVFLYNKSKKTKLHENQVLVNVDRLPLERNMIQLLSQQEHALDAGKKFQYVQQRNEFTDGDGTVPWKVVCSSNCTTIIFNSKYSHTFLFNDPFVLHSIENFVK